MTNLERYLFDLQGFLVVQDALSVAQVKAINQAIDQQISLQNDLEKPHLRFNRLLPWGAPFQDLIDNPKITPYMVNLLGPKFRLDHDYAHIIRWGGGPVGAYLHNGGTPFDPCQYYLYRNGQMYSGLTAVAYQLTDVSLGEGGFSCLPGSHKSDLPLPKELWDLEAPHPCVQEIPGKAGTAILFTEALSHGTLPWRGRGDRRTLFYKYSPCSSAWTPDYYNPNDFPNLTKAQREILKTPRHPQAGLE